MRIVLKNTFLSVASDSPQLPGLFRCHSSPGEFPESVVTTSTRISLASSLPSPSSDIPGQVLQLPDTFMRPTTQDRHTRDTPEPFDEAEDPLACRHPGCQSTPAVPPPTTIMLRNLPNKFDAVSILRLIDAQGFSGTYDFAYIPIDFRNRCNVGYGFINFRSHAIAEKFGRAIRGFQFPAVNSQKVCDVCWANVQGLEQNVEHYRNSPIIEKYRPFLFDEKGLRIPFPEPDSPVKATIALRETEALNRMPVARGPDGYKVFVGGLGKLATAESLKSYFQKFAPVKDTSIVIDRTSGKSRGFGFCLFDRPAPWAALAAAAPHVIDGTTVAVKRYSQENSVCSSQGWWPVYYYEPGRFY